MLKKPIIFFSHSSEDAAPLATLKRRFEEKTARAFDVFLSSDGASIRGGQNWQKTLEEALSKAELMFVFLTPTSIQSKWIYFEAGFAYAQGKRVVPVAFEGVSIANVGYPLQMFQGFNVSNYEGLNNLIDIANEKFNVQHALSFATSDYSEMLASATRWPATALGTFWEHVETLAIEIPKTERHDEHFWKERLSALPTASALRCQGSSGEVLLGLGISEWKNDLIFRLDGLAVGTVYPLLSNTLAEEGVQEVSVFMWFEGSVFRTVEPLRASASLIGTGWVTQGEHIVKQGDEAELSFELKWFDEYGEEGFQLRISGGAGIPALDNVREILNLCFSRGLLLRR